MPDGKEEENKYTCLHGSIDSAEAYTMMMGSDDSLCSRLLIATFFPMMSTGETT